jgi:hypothetical protein
MEDSGSEDKAQRTYSARWTAGEGLCPLVRDPLSDCYCYDMNSQKIQYAIYYCSDKYEQCVIFRRIKATRYRLETQ